MEKLIKRLHHVTSMAADAKENNQFFTQTLGLRRVKKTVNFDDPSTYHLYYGDGIGSPEARLLRDITRHARRLLRQLALEMKDRPGCERRLLRRNRH